jgi:hypothetical protein
VDPVLGNRIAEGIKIDIKKVKSLANMSQDERVKATL